MPAFILTKQNRKLAESWGYLNEGISKGQWNHEDFEGLDSREIIKLVEKLTAYEGMWRV